MNYLNALIEKNDQKKIEELEKLILLGEQLNKDVTPDRKKLEILQKRTSKNDGIYSAKVETPKQNEAIKSSTSSNDLYYSIKSVYTSGNTVVVDFNVDISEKDIKFFELNQKTVNKDVFDLKGYFKDAAPTKLAINGIDRIAIGQFKPDVLRIVLSDKKNLNTSYIVNKKQVIISINENSIKSNEPTVAKKNVEQTSPKEVVQTEETPKVANANSQEFVDTINPIRSMETQDNKIIVKFNKNYYKRDVQFVRYKNASNYENVFNLNGKYKYVNPIKLSIDGVDKIVVSENGSNGVKIRIINNDEQKVDYVLNDKELTITTYPSSPSNKNTNKATAVATKAPTPQPRVINKTIVIDPGHGADDVGAVGPNKRYEKVINLNVSKNLYSILKQRGYKVYLTRSSDTFIKVMNRTVLANDKNADIFISIHSNSVPKEKANEVSGIETFFLSPARNERAKRVAAIENKSDIREMSNSSKDVFLESLNRPRITASHKLAIDVQAGLLQSARSKYKDVSDSGVREGPFWVLVGAQMPSILVELGYVSHPVESKRLYDKNYQQSLANGIANGIDSYFSKNP
ncbi:N-acetylmuramoyl-L-alanine amidase [Arcobacter acticola]|uniref:N-acetylmuramoyl-L-alanine amidase n=1 Tax=Arcobacter acticola TaxID=1849015 RepID=A0A6M8ECA6_9BACT|nr:N-acetylmuramoyl-L-alanine amidase [Arcobacter acticola]QKE28110.1 N-acetylmuramoyl-L-alanine amidase [Arcobacter acticola]